MQILNVISSPRAGQSYSIKLANGILDKLKQEHPDAKVVTRDLATDPFPHLEEAKIQAFLAPAEQRTPDQKEAMRHSDEAIAEVTGSDVIVVGAPLYNFGIASTLKAWVDHISRAGVTFKYTDKGPVGLIEGKKVYVALSSGGVYSEGPYASYDFVAPYLKTIFAFLGMTDVDIVRVEGTAQPALEPQALQKALDSVVVEQSAAA